MGYFAEREAHTSIVCPDCGHNLNIHRLCKEVEMRCPYCRKTWPLKEFISQADAEMEKFLENVYFDRL